MLTLLASGLDAGLFRRSEPSRRFRQGRVAEKAGEFAKAYLLYSQAAALNPRNRKYWAYSQAVRSRAATEAKLTVTGDIPDVAPEFQPLDGLSELDLREARKPQPPKELNAKPHLWSFDLRTDARKLFEEVTKVYGLDVVFDGDYQAGPAVRFQMDQAGYREALRAAQAATGSFAVPLSGKLLFVAKDTQQKRNENEPTVSVTVAIPNPVSVQEATELARSVQQVMEVKKFGIDNTRRIVVMSDRISKVRPAQELFEELLHYKTEVMVELEFIEVDRNDSRTVGLTLPNSMTIGFFDPKIGLAQIAGRLVTIGGGMSLFGIAVPNAQFVAKMRESTGRTLLRAHMRSTDGTAANFHVGDKYPIMTGGYFGGVDSNNPSAYRPPPQFTFEDLGIVLKVTPKVHGSEEVALNVEAEFKVLAGEAVNGIPIISNRKVTAQLTVKNGAWGAVAGMMSGSEARSISGIAGLSQIPGLGALLRQHTRDRDTRDVLILLRPVIIGGASDQILTREIWVGPEGRLNVPL